MYFSFLRITCVAFTSSVRNLTPNWEISVRTSKAQYLDLEEDSPIASSCSSKTFNLCAPGCFGCPCTHVCLFSGTPCVVRRRQRLAVIFFRGGCSEVRNMSCVLLATGLVTAMDFLARRRGDAGSLSCRSIIVVVECEAQ